MLESIAQQLPEIYTFCHLAYGNPSILKFGNRSVISQEGAQQGDPLGPLLFCLAIHPILTSLSSNLVAGYLDDITLGGDEKTLAHDVSTIRARGEAMGLKLKMRVHQQRCKGH